MDTLIDKMSSYWEKFNGLKKERFALETEIEKSLVDRYIILLNKAGETPENLKERGGGLAIPFPIKLNDPDDEDFSIFITWIDIEKSENVFPISKSQWSLIMTVSEVNKEKGKIDSHGGECPFWKFSFTEKCVIYKDLVNMGFFDDSRIELFPDI